MGDQSDMKNSTPGSSVSEDGREESKTSPLSACEELIQAGMAKVLDEVVERLLRSSVKGDIAAGIVVQFLETQCSGSANAITLEWKQMIFRAVDEDPEFISEFSTRTRKMAIEFFSRKAHEASAEGLIERFDNV